MKLKYIVEPTNAGGAAVPGCGTIHISEIKPTLNKLSKDLGSLIDLNDYMVGSTGKREYSGDIDLVVDLGWWDRGPTAFYERLLKLFAKELVARNGEMVHLRYKIENYNKTYQGLQPRLGFVQIDFNFGDAAWERFYHYSDGKSSEYKGAHRNLAIAAICSAVNTQASPLLDFYDRPISQIRWKFGPKGFIRVNRHSVKDPITDKWCNKQVDTVIDGPYYNGNYIAKCLLPIDGVSKDLDSLETILLAIERNYGMVDQKRIRRHMAYNFSSWKYGKDFIYPTEISKYFVLNDK